MKVNIAKTTDKEIQIIIESLKTKGHNQWDEAWVEMITPFKVNPEGKNENKIGVVLYPELLSYYDGKTWVTVPWICVRAELENHHIIDETFKREFVKWLYEELKSVGYKSFYDEDAFAGCCSKEEKNGYTKLKLYINPDFPEGYWSNHTL